MVEAGELGAVRHLAGRAFVAGPHVNAYHGGTLQWLASRGAVRFVAPLEMDGGPLARLLEARPADMAAEVMGWGRMALAFSARCFTARHFRLKKDDCGFRCIEHPDGLDMRTRESREFLGINGIQVQSAACLDLLAQAPELARMGVDGRRGSPQAAGTLDAVAALDATPWPGLGGVAQHVGMARVRAHGLGGEVDRLQAQGQLFAHRVADVQVELAVGSGVVRIGTLAADAVEELVAPVVRRTDLPGVLVIESDNVGRVSPDFTLV
ncbi:hypothetical protein G6F50_013484 [Rhizopus delemar]|uniref:Uncharacterized protein n=1 Tax=Rhizopus delemar TaxID=936053 RepID=A0A9P7CDG1_9FUNG|nr:hypothetical protein G6F50_013484 [Rhizopus delemar]